MDHYVDIRLRPDPEIAPHQLLSAVYARLHRGLVQLASQDIGVSFPDYDLRKPTLGACLRLHGTQASLQRLLGTPWLSGAKDYVSVTPIAPVPESAGHRRIARVQAKSNPARLRRRAMRRHGIDADAALRQIPDSAAEQLKLPFVVIGSRSTGQPSFPLFIRQEPVQREATSGTFNSYGLSQHATVPWF
ncbi:type I-F CRISPR-associated endoribonuclease Cas6/Csy4 [Tahibacter sp. UC22_41]|uniref:type I-F CRISPR-associated endoribonuclease Cas6/Csy4 n=1 Tax=Tahibacter sp. UC22_41 TaxID=3350178 RepID=UPI0036DE99CF